MFINLALYKLYILSTQTKRVCFRLNGTGECNRILPTCPADIFILCIKPFPTTRASHLQGPTLPVALFFDWQKNRLALPAVSRARSPINEPAAVAGGTLTRRFGLALICEFSSMLLICSQPADLSSKIVQWTISNATTRAEADPRWSRARRRIQIGACGSGGSSIGRRSAVRAGEPPGSPTERQCRASSPTRLSADTPPPGQAVNPAARPSL